MCEVQSLGGLSTLLKADSISIGSRVFEVLEKAMTACAESMRGEDINWRQLLAYKLVPLMQKCPFLQETLLEHMTEDQTTIRATTTRHNLLIVMAGALKDLESHQRGLLAATSRKRRFSDMANCTVPLKKPGRWSAKGQPCDALICHVKSFDNLKEGLNPRDFVGADNMCPVCGTPFTHRDNCVRHMRRSLCRTKWATGDYIMIPQSERARLAAEENRMKHDAREKREKYELLMRSLPAYPPIFSAAKWG